MDKQTIIEELTESEALLRGHFILSSGLHSEGYVQCARALMNPARAEKLCKALADKVRAFEQDSNVKFDVVVAPAMGGVVVGYEMARQLGLEEVFCERVDGEFQFRRGFSLEKDAKVLIVEDVVTTGKSSMEAAKCIEAAGAKPLAVTSLIDRCGGSESHALSLPLISLVNIDFLTFSQDNVPEHLKEVPAVKPGSRWLKAS